MRFAFALLAGCLQAGATPPPAAPVVEPPLFATTSDAFGPLRADSPATLVALRRAFAGYTVMPMNSETLEYRVSLGGEPLFDVIADEDGAVLNVHVATPKLAPGGMRVGERFRGDASTCECWGDQIVCFKDGDHTAVALAKICREGTLASSRSRAALAGVPIRATIWSPRPLVPGGA
jgi:hypothetical protein